MSDIVREVLVCIGGPHDGEFASISADSDLYMETEPNDCSRLVR
jgi:hypothetical protein